MYIIIIEKARAVLHTLNSIPQAPIRLPLDEIPQRILNVFPAGWISWKMGN